MQPIWKDYEVALGAADYIDYEIRLGSLDGATIYAGRAYRRPGETQCRVRLNSICAAYLPYFLPAKDMTGRLEYDIAVDFVTAISVNDEWVAVDTVTFYPDWSYDYGYTPSLLLSSPLGALHRRQRVLWTSTAMQTASNKFTTYDAAGTPWSITLVGTAGKYGIFATNLYSIVREIVRLSFNGLTYEVSDVCAPYVLHYINAYGGWDSVIIVSAKESHALERHTALIDYDNSDISARGRKDYAAQVTPEWELTTDWLADGNPFSLLDTPLAFLEDLTSHDFIPVVLTGTENTRKDRGLISYTFTAQLAQEQFRK